MAGGAQREGLFADSPLLGLSQRQPPGNLQAERALLGAILANNRAFHRVVGFLKPEHFLDPINGVIYREAARLILRDRLADAVTLKSVFEQNGRLDEVGGTAYLAQLLTAMVGILNAGEYGRAVYDGWLRRQLISVGSDMVERAFGAELELDGEAQVGAASDALLELSEGSGAQAPDVSAGDAARVAVRQSEARARGDGGAGLRSGLAPLDDLIGDLWGGWFYVLGGRPGMGKTSLATQIGVAAARQLQREESEAPPFSGAGGDVVIFSLEMSAEQLAGWMVCQMANVSNDVLRKRGMTTDEAARMLAAQRELDALPIRVIDAVGMSGPAIALRCRAMNARRRVRLVLVDHVQKIVAARDGKETETVATQKTSSALKDLARKIGVPVLALWQLSRDVDKREDARPRLSDLLYGGETDADVAFFLYRAERYLPKRPPEKFGRETDEQHAKRVDQHHKRWAEAKGRAEIICGKRREGPEGACVVRFVGETTSFFELGAAADPDQGDWVDDGFAG